MDKKTITLELTNYIIRGEVSVIDCNGKENALFMDDYYVDAPDLDSIKAGLNTSRFGVQKVLSASIDIYENYDGYEVYVDSINIDL